MIDNQGVSWGKERSFPTDGEVARLGLHARLHRLALIWPKLLQRVFPTEPAASNILSGIVQRGESDSVRSTLSHNHNSAQRTDGSVNIRRVLHLFRLLVNFSGNICCPIPPKSSSRQISRRCERRRSRTCRSPSPNGTGR